MSSPDLLQIPVFYSILQNADVASFSPSAGKPALLAGELCASGMPLRWVVPSPVEVGDLQRVHAASYVAGILDGSLANGFGTRDRAVARSLLHTCGAMLGAARAATPELPAAALVSGFHHAGWSHNHGFCTFNGLMVAAAALFAEGRAERVAILDCDAHVGDGTEDILNRVPGLGPRILHAIFGNTRGHAYLGEIEDLARRLAEFGPDLILYQAGADPHVDDPLGGVLTSPQLRRRDLRVFQIAKRLGIPVAWNLAGGYQRGGRTGIDPVLAIHMATFEAAVRVYIESQPEGQGERGADEQPCRRRRSDQPEAAGENAGESGAMLGGGQWP